MPIPISQVDSFTSVPFAGNPAAVCVLPEPRSAAWMQNVAREMNVSETAFLVRKDGRYDLRWFTPAVEVDLCGHATLASAHILWESGELAPREDACFETRSGLLIARQAKGAIAAAGSIAVGGSIEAEGSIKAEPSSRAGGWIEMDFPSDPPAEIATPPGLAEMLGCDPAWVGKGRFDLFVQTDTEQTVRALKPDFRALTELPYRGIVVTAESSEGYDFVSRFFAPASGIDEDPVTGSAHCSLGPFWQQRLGRDRLTAFQASARGGEVRVEPRGERVLLAGKAVTVLRGELLD
jgi:predicted PhzF superfamily epimerase YddE/YHI9